MTKTNLGFSDDHETTAELIGVTGKQPFQRSNLVRGPFISQAKQYHPLVRTSLAVDFVAEVLIRGNASRPAPPSKA